MNGAKCYVSRLSDRRVPQVSARGRGGHPRTRRRRAAKRRPLRRGGERAGANAQRLGGVVVGSGRRSRPPGRLIAEGADPAVRLRRGPHRQKARRTRAPWEGFGSRHVRAPAGAAPPPEQVARHVLPARGWRPTREAAACIPGGRPGNLERMRPSSRVRSRSQPDTRSLRHVSHSGARALPERPARHVLAVQRRYPVPASGGRLADERAEKRRLARAGRPQDPRPPPRARLEVDAAEDGLTAADDAQPRSRRVAGRQSRPLGDRDGPLHLRQRDLAGGISMRACRP